MRSVLLPIAFLLPAPALAQTALERIEPRLAAAIAEHRVFLTCARGGPDFGAIRLGWLAMVKDARAILAGRGASPAELDAFDARASLAAVMLPEDAPASDMQALCAGANADWRERYESARFIYRIDETPP